MKNKMLAATGGIVMGLASLFNAPQPAEAHPLFNDPMTTKDIILAVEAGILGTVLLGGLGYFAYRVGTERRENEVTPASRKSDAAGTPPRP